VKGVLVYRLDQVRVKARSFGAPATRTGRPLCPFCSGITRAMLYPLRRGKPISCFPAAGFCSILTVLDDGSLVEVATIGREGMVGVSVILDAQQLSTSSDGAGLRGRCYRMSIRASRREFDRRGSLLCRYAW
jgi:hypothetical protein